MAQIKINKLGPITHCELDIKEFMIFTGPQASGKSTIAKSIFFFKNIKMLLLRQSRRRFVGNFETISLSLQNRLIKELRSIFLQTFGSTWCMDKKMSLEYYYTEDVYIKISLKENMITPNYIWIDFSPKLISFIKVCENTSPAKLLYESDVFQNEIDNFFGDNDEVVYIPAGRSMMTLFSSQLMFLYSVMDDEQKRSLDYCTQQYLERIMQLKPAFSDSLQNLIRNKIEVSETKIQKEKLQQCVSLMQQILHGEYRNVDGEERLQVSNARYIKINYASSGQQEAVWILNVVFYYLLNNKKAYFIIEEPESHLFPNAQKLIAEFISLAKNAGNKVLVTTHSPYILGAFNNLLYANKISKKVNNETLNQIIDKNKWLDFSNMSAYYVEQGHIELCLDKEFKSICNEVIDNASICIEEEFNDMLDLLYEDKE